MTSELKPCLLCEGEAKLRRRSGRVGRACPSKWYRERIECKVCGLTTREYKSPGAAKRSWNTRPTPTTTGPMPPADAFPQPSRKDGGEPCGECHLHPGETCDICGAIATPTTTGKCGELETVAWSYQKTFNAIGAAVKIQGDAKSISVKAFIEAFGDDLVTRSQAEELLAAERAEKEELRLAIMGKEPAPDLQHGNFLEMAATLHRACDGARKRAEYAEQRLGQSEAELKQVRADNAAIIHDLNRIKDHETELVNDNAAKDARIKELEEYAREATKAITGLTSGGSEYFGKEIGDVFTADLPYCLERIRERYVSKVELKRLEAKLEAAEKALEPLADIAGQPWADENGWTDAACQKDRIVDWFGPSAFFAARAALGGTEG